MRIIIFSDTHGRIEKCIDVIENAECVDMILHAGDYAEDAERIAEHFPAIPLRYVKGNNDFWTTAPRELEITVDGKKIFLTHGHYYHVKSGLSELKNKAAAGNYDMVVFGHTHQSFMEFSGKSVLLNPGSMGYYDCTYGVAEIENGRIRASIIKY